MARLQEVRTLMRIYHNVPALFAYNALNNTNRSLQKSIQTLSTGLRINSAADDAAGLAISEKMRAQISGMNMAIRNAEDGVSMLQTAEGALASTHSILQRMRELAVQAANDTLTQQDREYIQLEVDQLKDEINRISTATQFNNKKLLDGTSAGIWSSTDLATKAYIRGSLREIDQFGQKSAFEGNYKISITATPGQAEAKKTDIFRIKHPNVVMGASLNDQAGIAGLRVDNLPAGNYTVKTVNPKAHSLTGAAAPDFTKPGNRAMLFELTKSDGTKKRATISLTENVNNVAGIVGAINADLTAQGITAGEAKAEEVGGNVQLTSLEGKISITELPGTVNPHDDVNYIMGAGSPKESTTELIGALDIGTSWAWGTGNNKTMTVQLGSGAAQAITINGRDSGTINDLADALNAAFAANGTLNGHITASASGGKLRLVANDGQKITLDGADVAAFVGGTTTSTTVLKGVTPPDQFDFTAPGGLGSDTGTPLTMTVTTEGGTTTTVTLKTRITSIGELVAELNAQLVGTGVTAEADGDKVKLLSDKKITLGGADINTIMGAGAPTTSTETPLKSEARLTGKYGFAEGTDLAALLGTSVNDARLKNNASILFEVMSVNKDSKNVTLKATANVLKPDGSVTSVVKDNIVLNEGAFYDLSKLLGLGDAGTDPVNADGALEMQLKAGQTGKFSVGNKFVYNVTKKATGGDAQTVEISGTQTGTWPYKWGDNVTDAPLRFGLDAEKVKGKELHFRNFYLNDKNGTVYEGDIVLTTNETAMTEGKTLATFEAAYVGQVAKSDVKLRDLEKFWTTQGVFMLTDPQTITISQGDGKSTKITLHATDTLGELRSKLNDAIANGLGQARFAVSNANDFVTFVGKGTEKDYGLETVPGTFIIRSLVAGAAGRLAFSGNEDLVNALSLNVVQEAKENSFTASVYDAHTGATIASNVKVSGNQLIGVIHKNVDVEFDPMANIKVTWNENLRNFVLSSDGTPYETVLHIVDNSTIFQVGANEGEDLAIDIGNMGANALGVTRVIVTDRGSATRAITILDTAIGKVSTQRAKIGAYQNSLEHTVSNLTTTSTNLTAAESRIRDADMAKAMMEFVKLQVLNQSGTSMLAQANQLPQNVLSLLRS